MKIIRKNKAVQFLDYKLSDFIQNKTKKQKNNFCDNFLDLSNMTSGSFLIKKNKKVPIEIESDLLVVKKGNIIYGKCRPNLDKAVYVENKGLTTTEVLVYDGNHLPLILAIFHSKDFINYNVNRATGSKMPRTNNNNVLNYKFKLPINFKFELIGSFLLDFQKYIRNIENIIEKLETRNQYYAEKLLSGEKRIRKNEQGEIEFYDNKEWQKFYIQKRCFEIPKDYQPILLKNCDFIKLTRGKIISKKDIEKNNGCYPIYSSSVKNNGLMGNYGNYDYDEELITWSVDGGGDLFYREKHKFSVTNVSGIMKIVDNFNAVKLKYLYYLFSWQHKKYKFDYSNKAHPSVINELYFFTNINIEEQINIINYLDVLFKEKEILENLLIKEKLRFQWMLDNLLSGEYQIVD